MAFYTERRNQTKTNGQQISVCVCLLYRLQHKRMFVCVVGVWKAKPKHKRVFFNGLLVGSHQVLLQLIYDCKIKTFLVGEIILFY